MRRESSGRNGSGSGISSNQEGNGLERTTSTFSTYSTSTKPMPSTNLDSNCEFTYVVFILSNVLKW